MTRTIQLTRGYEAIIDDEDYEAVSQFNWYALVNERYNKVYAQSHAGPLETGKDGRSRRGMITLHRFLMNPPARIPVDHEDHDGLNNTRANLRIVTPRQNALNSRKPNRSSASVYKGVQRNFYRREEVVKWVAMVRLPDGSKVKRIGTFLSELEAALAYDDAVRRLHGEFAATNESLGLGVFAAAPCSIIPFPTPRLAPAPSVALLSAA